MDFNIGNLVSSVVGAVVAVAIAVAEEISSVRQAVIGAEAAVANGEIDEEEINEAIEKANKVLVGAFMAMFGAGLSERENETENGENNDKYRINKGESGDGFWGKVADAWVSSSVYDALASIAEWEDENPEAMDVLNFMTIFMHPGRTGGANGVEYKSQVIENRSTQIEERAGRTTNNPIINNIRNKVPNDEVNSPESRGNAPISNKDGRPIEIHHNDQKPEGPFDEMHPSDHRYGENYKENHPNYNEPSKIDRKQFRKHRREYWENEWDNGRWNK
ncbi:HNH/ENDO VII family nuclease [Clostridium saccharobutylicum]|uniref:LHH domain-containing protein n=1 Tax=Clostridium saccharobutylicum DSM 13864 TaxID=1345695 RepID=U5MUP0_CLOSA|nr:HNH/ENDO VII family nuclease [Clostridium saccharobutylicum]AGX44484.1 hypothetical protein CLSA_c35230 [Clostridium saccharobutylicum DSM 13864]AQR91778.1 hypothetical protein CLOSC_35060 [Clostridium saccharobutylicum]AQS01680.1 hypothetical protein CSACC_35110 [Clostridium saccharobutylicum]AQS15663.1 hypothetical protein CLOSACC_35110 [Clostridium saccharobutylicum]MBA2907440.1 hypothetical protein [Clostridium saccharobutylicum]